MRNKGFVELHRARSLRAFSLVELMVAVSIAALLFGSIYTTLAFGFDMVRVTRESLRATQILEQKMETVRLYNWYQITNTAFITSNFVDVFYPGPNAPPGLNYTGTVTVATVPISEIYSNDLRSVSVALSWKSGAVVRTRTMQTYVSRYGIQNYTY